MLFFHMCDVIEILIMLFYIEKNMEVITEF